MKILEKYTGEKTYHYPNGLLATPERIKKDFPAVGTFEHVIITNELGEICFSVQNLDALKSAYGIPLKTETDTAIEILEKKLNEPPKNVDADQYEQLRADVDYMSIMTGVKL